MPTYDIGGKLIRRKNGYMPCIIGERFDDLPPEEQERLFKATRWADLIAAAEWPVVLGHDDAAAYNRSRLKRKLVHWLMALGRVAALRPELFDQALDEAAGLYRDQIETPHPLVVDVHRGKLAGRWVMWRFGDVAESPQPETDR